MKTIFTNHRFTVPLLIAILCFASISTSYSQFVEKKNPPAKKDKEEKKKPKKEVKTVVKTVIRNVSNNEYDMPNWSFGVHIVPIFGTNALVEVAPFVTKKFTNKLQGGLGAVYALSRIENGNNVVSRNHLGVRIFAQYFPTKYLFGHAEIGAMSIDNGGIVTNNNSGQVTTTSDRNTGADFIVGGGFRFPIGKKLALQIMMLHDMARQNNANLHNTNYVRLGITF